MSQSMVWDTFGLTSKALSALIDCNSSPPEGRQRYRRQTAGESSFSVRQTSREFHIRWCATRCCLSLQDHWISNMLKYDISSFQRRDVAPNLCTLICEHVCVTCLISHTWLGPHGPLAVALKWHGLDCWLIAMGLIKGALGMNNSWPRWGRNDVVDALC